MQLKLDDAQLARVRFEWLNDEQKQFLANTNFFGLREAFTSPDPEARRKATERAVRAFCSQPIDPKEEPEPSACAALAHP
jgi:hypothetical protein